MGGIGILFILESPPPPILILTPQSRADTVPYGAVTAGAVAIRLVEVHG